MASVEEIFQTLKQFDCSIVTQSNDLKLLTLERFSDLVIWIFDQLNKYTQLETCVRSLSETGNEQQFHQDVNSLLSELGFSCLRSLNDANELLIVIDFLLSELIALSYLQDNQPMDYEEIAFSNPAADLQSISKLLGLYDQLKNLPEDQVFGHIKQDLQQKIQDKKIICEEALIETKGWTQKHWDQLEKLEKSMHEEYKNRKQMLITRCDCTIESFKWSKGGRKMEEDRIKEIDELIYSSKFSLLPIVNVSLADALACKSSDLDNLVNSKISGAHQTCTIIPPENTGMANAGKLQRLSLHKFLIGQVPDRGGRPGDVPVPSKETFFTQQQNDRFRGNGRGRGGMNRPAFQKNISTSNFQEPQQANLNRIQGAGWNQSSQSDLRAQQFNNGLQNRRDQFDDNRNSKRGRGGSGGYRGRGRGYH